MLPPKSKLFKFKLIQSKSMTQFGSICVNHLHCLACVNEMTMMCS
jgi:hypothetical protein